jgi:hypothetical protein
MAGNTDPNAGFVRDNAVLGIVMVTDEEDGSVRDCRYAERGVPCTDAVSVFDITSPQWSSNDLNLRFYLYTPGSAQDPTWPIDRYIDPRAPTAASPRSSPAAPTSSSSPPSRASPSPPHARRDAPPRRRSTGTRSSAATPTAPTATPG